MEMQIRFKFFFVLFFCLWLIGSSTYAQGETIRLMAANITSGSDQSYDPGHGNRIFEALEPDIVLIQEFNVGNNSSADISDWVYSVFGSGFSYYRESGAQLANGIVSRYPILESGEWYDYKVSNRDFAWARIDIPGPKHLFAVSVHLLTTNATTRNQEAIQLRNYILDNVPADDYLVIGGDINSNHRNEYALGTLSSVVVKSGPYPKDQEGNGNTNRTRGRPYDWILVDSDLNALKIATTVGSSTFSSGLVFDSRTYVPLSEVSPVLFSDSNATNMQHMAVIRDFFIPLPEPEPDPDPDPVPGSGLSNGEEFSDSVATGAWDQFLVDLPSGVTELLIELDPDGSGDADLYVKKGSEPSTSSYDFRPYLAGSDETVTVSLSTSPTVSSGGWYIGVHGYSAASYKLKVSWVVDSSTPPDDPPPDDPPPDDPPPDSGATVLVDADGSVLKGKWKNYTVTVPSGGAKLTIVLTGSGDGDLYVKKGGLPTLTSYDFRPYLYGTDETVVIDGTTSPPLSAGSWVISVYGYDAASFHITVTLE